MVWTYNQSGETYDDTGALWDGLDPAETLTVLVGTPAAASVITDIQWRSFSATDNGTSGRGLIRFRVEQALSALTTVTDQAMVKVVDHALNTETHRGFIRSRRPVGRPLYDATEIVADDLGSLLDDTFIAVETRPAETMLVRITAFWLLYKPPYLDNTLTFVASIGGTLPEQTFSGVTLREAIEATISQASASADYYIDAIGRLHIFTSEANDAPFDIDTDAPGAGEVAPESLEIEYDSNQYTNRVYVQGATPEASGYFADATAIAAVNGLIRTQAISAPECTTEAEALAAATRYLTKAKASIPRGTFVITGVDGWQAGQNVLVTDSAKGLSAQTFRIQRVTKQYVRPGASPVFRYTVEFGAPLPPRDSWGPVIGVGQHQLGYGNLGGDSRTFATVAGISVTDET